MTTPRAFFLQSPPQHPKDSRRWLSLVLSALLVLLLLGVVLWICHRPNGKADNGKRTSEIISASGFQLSALDKPSIEIVP
jgi:hypothetical protein